MKNVLKCFRMNSTLNSNRSGVCELSCDNYSTAAAERSILKESKKEKHPFKKIHPWKSFKAFSESLAENVIYNNKGLVALNKPYGIASRLPNKNVIKAPYQEESLNKISGAVDYSIPNALPFLAKRLGYANLTVVKAPERYMSGVTLLAANDWVERAIIKSQNRAISFKRIPKVYWVVTTRLPKAESGSEHLVLKLHRSPCGKFERPVLHNKWSKTREKRQEIKVMNTEYKVLSNSIDDLSALIEIRSSTTKWHAIRVFAATILNSPILGDMIHGSRIQNIMGTYMKVNPFLPSVDKPPKIDPKLLKLLNMSEAMQDIIPAHIHLKRIELPWFLGEKKDLAIEAPLSSEFSWTCQALNFKLPEEDTPEVQVPNPAEELESVQVAQ